MAGLSAPDVTPLPYEEGGDVRGAPLVVLHGFLGDRRDFTSLRGACRDRRVVVVDLPGHGAARTHPGSWDIGATCRALDATLTRLAIERADVVGYSMGGRIALAFALAYPRRVRRLVLESASPGLDDEHERGARRASDERWATRFETEDLQSVLEDWYAQPVLATVRERPDFAAHLEARLENDGKALARSLREVGLAEQPSYWAALPSLVMPLLLVTGERDKKFGGIAERMRASMRPERVRHVVVEGAGHAVHTEAPLRYAEVLASYLREERDPHG